MIDYISSEKYIRSKIMEEALKYETNFNGIDTLIKFEDDYYVARDKFDSYNFSNCPSVYNIMLFDSDNCREDGNCELCWKNAFENRIYNYKEIIQKQLEKLRKNNPENDIYTLENFINLVNDGLFNKYDGNGYLGTFYKETDKFIECSIDWLSRIDSDKYPFIWWYNK